MAMAIAGVLNSAPERGVERPHANVSSTGEGGSSNGSTATIAANDFLTLLVTEMKNQDPTAATDPNEYVNQLVQVNSLQQLISINETLQKAAGTDSSSSQTPNGDYKGVSDSSAAVTAGNNKVASGMSVHDGSRAALRIATALTR